MLTDDIHKYNRLRSRKRTYTLIRYIIFGLLVVSQILECISSIDTQMDKTLSIIMYSVGFSIISVVIMAMTTLIAMALYMFIKIVSHTQEKQDMNITAIVLGIIGLFGWTITWLFEGVIFLLFYRSKDYKPFRNVVIIDTISFVMNLEIFLIIAYVIYRTSKVVSQKHDPILKQDVSLLAYMRNRYSDSKAQEDDSGTKEPLFIHYKTQSSNNDSEEKNGTTESETPEKPIDPCHSLSPK